MTSQHRSIGLVLTQHQRDEDRRLTASFLALRKHLAKDPHPSLWRNRRRSSNALRCPGMDAVRVAELALDQALATRDVHVIEATAQECDHYFEQLRSRGMRKYCEYANGALSLHVEGLATHRDLTQASHAITEVLASNCPTRVDVAMKAVSDVVRSCRRWWFAAQTDVAPPRKHAIP